MLDAFEPVAAEWETLADEVGSEVFLRPGWMAAWWEAFGDGELEIITVRRGGALCGVLPVRSRRGAVEALTNHETPLYEPLARTPADADVLLTALFARRPHRVEVLFFAEPGPGMNAFDPAATAAGYRTLGRVVQRPPYIQLTGSFEEFMARRNRKLRSNLRRRRRQLEEAAGPMALEVLDGREGLGALLDVGWRLEAAGWKGARGTAIEQRDDMRRFYDLVARWTAPQGLLRLAFLRFGDRLAAFDFCIEGGPANTHCLIKNAYEPELRRYSPGLLLRHAMISRAFELGFERYEFGGHDEPWKMEWTTTRHTRMLVQAFAPTMRGSLGHLEYARLRPLAKRVLRRG